VPISNDAKSQLQLIIDDEIPFENEAVSQNVVEFPKRITAEESKHRKENIG
jgi:hypothetical protein